MSSIIHDSDNVIDTIDILYKNIKITKTILALVENNQMEIKMDKHDLFKIISKISKIFSRDIYKIFPTG